MIQQDLFKALATLVENRCFYVKKGLKKLKISFLKEIRIIPVVELFEYK